MSTSAPPLVITVDDNLLLREITTADAPAIFKLIDSNRVYLRKWLPFVDYTRAVSDTESYILGVTEAGNFSDLVFVILYREQHVGVIGFKGVDLLNKKLEVGYWLAEAHQGKGIMIRCCKAVINYAFDKLDINRVQLKVAIGNEKSKSIPLKLGFKKEGVERDGELGSMGVFYDLEVYSLLKREWQK
ncbi:GNAT family N-acetyltransferase [Pontibacter locisalis]|uniref:GNAT family N-acetyltransferase n=1 Tax=Pontibacter locisalis TaxID=1719035 RepID=A0ABW5IPJ1_9BACT